VSLLIFALLLAGGSFALVEGDPASHILLVPNSLKWIDIPTLPGAKQAVLYGNPKEAGPYVMRIKFPPHPHPDNRQATMIWGTWYFGHSGKFDASKEKKLPPGTFFTEPANSVHYNLTKGGAVIIQASGTGPTGTIYLKSAEASKQK
jgi:hypothetical protein